MGLVIGRLYSRPLSMEPSWDTLVIMVESIFYGSTIGLLLLMQAMIIWECLKMKGHVTGESSNLRETMADMGSLLDEALDYIADLSSAKPPSPMVQGAGESIQSMLLTGLMNKMMMPPDHGPQKQEERQVHQEQPKTHETENESS